MANTHRTITNLTDKAKDICKTLRRGFNGVRIPFAYVEDIETEKDYAAFIVEPEFPVIWAEDEPYLEPATFNDRQFYEDLVAFVQKEVGEDVKVTHHRSCCEFEIERLRDQSASQG